METNLLPCPFCGGEAGISVHDNHYVVECMNQWCEVGAYTELRYPQSAEQAIEAWNTRAERTCRVESSYYDELMDEDYTDLSCGHHVRGAEWEFLFCPKCGCRVEVVEE